MAKWQQFEDDVNEMYTAGFRPVKHIAVPEVGLDDIPCGCALAAACWKLGTLDLDYMQRHYQMTLIEAAIVGMSFDHGSIASGCPEAAEVGKRLGDKWLKRAA